MYQEGECYGPTLPVLRKVSTIIPLGNLTKRGSSSKAFETKRSISSEPGYLMDRERWISKSGIPDGFEECEVSARGPHNAWIG